MEPSFGLGLGRSTSVQKALDRVISTRDRVTACVLETTLNDKDVRTRSIVLPCCEPKCKSSSESGSPACRRHSSIHGLHDVLEAFLEDVVRIIVPRNSATGRAIFSKQ